MNYWPFHIDIFENSKVDELRDIHGNDGLVAYQYFITCVAKNVANRDFSFSFKLNIREAVFRVRCEYGQLEKIIESLLKLNLIQFVDNTFFILQYAKYVPVERFKYGALRETFKQKRDSALERYEASKHGGTVPVLYQYSSSTVQELSKERKVKESKVKERKGKKDICPLFQKDEKADVFVVFEYWCKVFEKNKSTRLTEERAKKVTARLKLYTVDEIYQAIDGCKKSPFHNGQNDTRTQHNDLELICRNDTHLEKFIEYAAAEPGTNEPDWDSFGEVSENV